MSAAWPSMCCDWRAPPTALFTAYDLKPEFTRMGAPYKSLAGCNTLPHSLISACTSWLFGWFVIPVLVVVSSVRVKFFVIFIVICDFVVI